MPTPLLLLVSWEGVPSARTERDSPGAQAPPLPGAWLSSCGGLSPVSVQTLRHTHLTDPLLSAPRDSIGIFLLTLLFSSASDVEGSGCCSEGQSI